MSEIDTHAIQMRRRYQRLALSLLLLVVVVGVQPLVWRFVKSQARLVHSRRTLQQQQADVRLRAQAMHDNVVGNAETIATLDAVVPPLSFLPQAVERLELLADKRSLSLQIISINQRPDAEVPAVVPVGITLLAFGPIETIIDFMDQIEQLQEVTSIASWQLEPAALPAGELGTANGSNYRLSAEVLFFFAQP